MSKGSTRRREDTQKIRDNWDAIFGKKDPKDELKTFYRCAREKPSPNKDAK